MKKFSIIFLLVFNLLLTGCKKDDLSSDSACGQMVGEKWTYQVIGNGYKFSILTEPVTGMMGGYKVYRWRRSDSPNGLGDYIGCDATYGKVWVATDSWDVFNPANFDHNIFDPAIPIDLCPYGTAAGTTRDNSKFVDFNNRTEYKVISYEDVTVPYGSFSNVQKLQITLYDDGHIDDNEPPIYRWVDKEIGMIKELEVVPQTEIGSVLIAYSHP